MNWKAEVAALVGYFLVIAGIVAVGRLIGGGGQSVIDWFLWGWPL